MSHKCGSGCYRKQGKRSECPRCGKRRNRLTHAIRAGGKIRRVSAHMLNNAHPEIRRQHVTHALENWIIRGVRTDRNGRESRVYLGFVPGMKHMLRVAVSMDDKSVVSAFPRRNSNPELAKGQPGVFRPEVCGHGGTG